MHDSGPQGPPPVPHTYWLTVCRGMEAAEALVLALREFTPQRLDALVRQYPVLMLPELPHALRGVAEEKEDSTEANQWTGASKLLGAFQSWVASEQTKSFAVVMVACATELAAEERGERPINLQRSIQLLAASRSYLEDDPPRLALCLKAAAEACTELAHLAVEEQANLETAAQLYRQAYTLFDENSEQAGTCLVNESLLRAELAQLGHEPRENLEKALRLARNARASFNISGPDRARCLVSEGIACLLLADLGVDSRANLEAAAQLYGEARGMLGSSDPRRMDLIGHEHDSLLALAKMGVEPRSNSEKADQLARETMRALMEEETSERERTLALATTLLNNAMVNLDYGEQAKDPEEAWRALKRALFQFNLAANCFEELGGDQVAMCLMGEANAMCVATQRGRGDKSTVEKSLQLYSKAKRLLPTGGPYVAGCLLNEGQAHRILAELDIDPSRNFAEAERLFRQAGAEFRHLATQTEAIKALSNLGRLGASTANWEVAAEGFGEAIHALEQVRGSTHLLRDRQAWMEKNAALFKGMVDACLRLGRYNDALEYVERGRSRALVDLLYIDELTPRNTSPEQVEEYRRLRRRTEELEALLEQSDRRVPDGHGRIDEEHRAAVARERIENAEGLRLLERQLRRVDPDFLPVAKPLSTREMVDVARALGRTVAILWVGSSEGTAFFVGPGGEVDHLPLPGLSDALVGEWMYGIGDPPESGWLGTYQRYRDRKVEWSVWLDQIDRTAEQLYAPLIGPVHRWLRERGEGRVALIVGGHLGLLPLHAASWEEQGRRRHLVEELEIVYAPSAWVLARCAERARPGWKPVLGVADPFRPKGTELPYSVWELERISALIDARAGAGTLNPLVGAEATLEEVARQLPSHPVAHFACHARWNRAKPLESALLLAGEGQDRDLTLAHLFVASRLDQARLTVLSACESAIGHRPGSAGEEYLGLPAGFIVAGAKAAVGSLWGVPDAPTALLLTTLYEGLLSGRELSAALREAQLWLRTLSPEEAVARVANSRGSLPEDCVAKYKSLVDSLGDRPFSHPYFWAAFGAFGWPGVVIPEQEIASTPVLGRGSGSPAEQPAAGRR